MARVAASITDVYGPSANLMFPSTSAANAPLPGSTNTALSAGPTSSGSVPVTAVLQGLQGSIFSSPLTWLWGLVLFLIAWKLIEEHRGTKEEFQKIRVDGTNLVKVGVMAVIFLIIARYFAARYSVPGLSDLIVGGT
jgi:hypothetical protein